uniref:replication initiation protein n=1 Tax=Lactobacillus crispatus TaxID=47770 RepID=UPI0021BD46C1|nr:replication initiation protein [Lactobacillus crispatus]UVZ00370.1 replication protein B [Lactobacillus crispatus]
MAYDDRGKKLEHHDIAKISNAINNFQLHQLSKNEIKVFWTVISQMANQTDDEIVNHGIHFSYKEISELAGFKHLTKARLYNLIRSMFTHLAQTLFIKEDKTSREIETTMFTPLKMIKIKKMHEDVWVKANEEMIPFLRRLRSTYTSFELARLITLDSRYSLRLYTILMQWKKYGKVTLSKDYFYNVIDIPPSYRKKRRTSMVDYRIIQPAIKELKDKGLVTNLSCTKKYLTASTNGGRTVSDYIFTFDPQKLEDKKPRTNLKGKFRKVESTSVKSTDEKKQNNSKEKNSNFNREKKDHKSTVKDHTSDDSMIDSAFGNLFD